VFFLLLLKFFVMNQKTIFSTALLPNIDFMVALLNANNICFEQNESYKKQSYRNRYCISGPNGLQTLTIPVNKNATGRNFIGNHGKLHIILLPFSSIIKMILN